MTLLAPHQKLSANAAPVAFTLICGPTHSTLIRPPRRPSVRIELERFHQRWCERLPADREAGTTTAEYAIGTLAACAFAAVLYKILTGGSVAAALGGLIHRALGMAG